MEVKVLSLSWREPACFLLLELLKMEELEPSTAMLKDIFDCMNFDRCE
jgi:hypothetical protein